jgi:uncharacterized protein YggE
MKGKTISTILLVVAVMSIQRSTIAAKDEDSEPPTLSVSGTGTISARPDVAVIDVGVVTQAPLARDALAANSKAMSQLQEILKGRGIAAKDIQTSQFQIVPQYSQPRPRPFTTTPPPAESTAEFVPRIVAYQVTNTVHVTARQIDKLGETLDAVVQAGANQIHGITLRVDKPEKLLDEARKRAMADAKHKAELLAGEANVVLGAPRSISEGTFQRPRPMFAGRMMTMAAADGAPVPIAEGEQELSVTVQVIYDIRSPSSGAR